MAIKKRFSFYAFALAERNMKARLVFASPDTNPGKLQALDRLHQVYLPYVQLCINFLVLNKITAFSQFNHDTDPKHFFPPSDSLSANIAKSARWQAIAAMKSWVNSRYIQKIRKHINEMPIRTNETKPLTRHCFSHEKQTEPAACGRAKDIKDAPQVLFPSVGQC